jgi:hypothetical protein
MAQSRMVNPIDFGASNLKTVLGKINSQYANLRHGCLPLFGSYETTLAQSIPLDGGIHRISSMKMLSKNLHRPSREIATSELSTPVENWPI